MGALSPNFILTGPTAPRSTNVVVETPMQALNDWLKEMREASYKIVFVTMGSMIALKKWQVEGIYHGLEALGCAVIWSLKEDQQAFLPSDRPSRFFINKWLP